MAENQILTLSLLGHYQWPDVWKQMFRSKVGCKDCGRKSGKGKLREVLGEVR